MNRRLDIAGVTFHFVFGDCPAALREGARQFWTELDILSESPDERLQELVIVATGDDGLVIGTSTARLMAVPSIGTDMYFYRNYVSPRARRGHVAHHLMLESFADLEARDAENPRAGGLYIIVDNPMLRRIQNEATWFESRYLFIGRTVEDFDQRIRYFAHARMW